MKKLYLFALLSLALLIPSVVKADCNDQDSITIQNKARNITTSYLYNETNNKYYITLNNISDEFKVYSYRLGRYINSVNGEANIIVNAGGEYRFDISLKSDTCNYNILEYKYVKMPFYNKYFNSEACKGIEEFKYCQKWFDTYQYDSKVLDQIDNYRNSIKKNDNKEENTKQIKSIFEYAIDFIVKYYKIIAYIVLPIILIILIVIIIRKRKKEDLF